MSIGSRLRDARKEQKLTQEELALKIGVTKGAIANYENQVSVPKVEILFKLMKTLNVDANYIYQDDMVNIQQSKPSEDVNVETLDEKVLLLNYRQLTEEGKDSLQKQMIMHVNTYKKDMSIPDMEASEELA